MNHIIMQSFLGHLNEQKHLLTEMARVGFFKEGILLEVIVFTDDPGYKPHFHIRDANTKGEEFHTCIEILHPKYFHHMGKEDVLNSKMKRSLMKYLNEQSEGFDGLSNWEVLIRLWNQNNSKLKVKKDIEIPDYLKL